MRTGLRVLTGAAALVVLGAVSAAYLNPHVVVDLANKVWSCF